jgi:hypothetical protein
MIFSNWLEAKEKVIPLGMCFQYAYQYMRKNGGTVVHSTVHDPWDHHAFEHAWVEKDGMVYDWQNMVLRDTGPQPEKKFYEMWKPKNIRKFTDEEAMISLARNGHYGPWEPFVSLLKKRKKRNG